MGAGCSENTSSNVAATTNQNSNASASQKPEPPKNPTTPFEKALFNVRVGDFEQVLVFSRPDGGVLTTDDIEFFKAHTENEQGREINRRLKSDDNKFIVAGTNFLFKTEQLAALQQQFNIRDYTSSNEGRELDLSQYSAEEKARQATAQEAANKK